MTTEQAVELLSLVSDIRNLVAAMLAALGLIIGVKLFNVMFASTSRSGFWGGAVLLACLFLPADLMAEWTYTQWRTHIQDDADDIYDRPNNADWTAFVAAGGSPQTHWTTWWNNGSPPSTANGAYKTQFLADSGTLQAAYTTWAGLIQAAGLTAPTQAEYLGFGTNSAQRTAHWTTWRKYYPQPEKFGSVYAITFNGDRVNGQLLPTAPGDVTYQALINATYAAGQITPTLAEYTAYNTYGGNSTSHWAAWWNNGSPTGNTGAGAWRAKLVTDTSAQQSRYNHWHNWSTPIEDSHMTVPTIQQWEAFGGTDDQREQYWELWASYYLGSQGNDASAFLVSWLADTGVRLVPEPPVTAEYMTWAELVASWGINPPSYSYYSQLVLLNGGGATQHVHDWALLNPGNTTGYQAAVESAIAGGSSTVPISGGSDYVAFARTVLTGDQTPPLETDHDAYEAMGFDADAYYDLWQTAPVGSGPQAFTANFADNLATAQVVYTPQGTVEPCCPLPSTQPAPGIFWVSSRFSGRRVTNFQVTGGCGQCSTFSATIEYRCHFDSNFPLYWQSESGWMSGQATANTCTGGTGCGAFTCAEAANGDIHGRKPNCLEAAFITMGCSAPMNCQGKTFDCVLCAAGYPCGDCTGCSTSGPPDPPECDSEVDGDCDGCPDAEEPCEDPPPCPGDKDCDDCPDERDSSPRVEGGTCDPEEPPECEGDADCDDCPDAEEGGAGGHSENPACQCEGGNDRNCDGCEETWDGETREWVEDCEEEEEDQCADKGGDSDRDGCCDDDDDDPSEASDGEGGCSDCSSKILAKINQFRDRIAGRWLPAMVVGNGSVIEGNVNIKGITGGRQQWRINFLTGAVAGTFESLPFFAGASESFVGWWQSFREIQAAVILVLMFMVIWRIVSSLGGSPQ